MTCLVCGYKWARRNVYSLPVQCPRCQSRYWNNEEKAPKKQELWLKKRQKSARIKLETEEVSDAKKD